jgi:REP element-mobilizing transposase RayT
MKAFNLERCHPRSSAGAVVSIMGRFNRVVALDIPHHVTQRGNARRFILDCDADRAVYLKLLRENSALCGLALIGYCLMSNHVHLIAIPAKAEGLAEGAEPNSWTLCLLMERRSPIKRARLARAILFLSLGRDAPVGSFALYRTEPGEGSIGFRSQAVALVERSQPLHHRQAR